MAATSEVEVVVKSSPEKFWEAIRNSTELAPNVFPDHCKSVNVLEGDGKSVGSVRHVNYAQGLIAGMPMVTFAKQKVETVDEKNKLLSYSVIDSEILSLYKNFKATLSITPKGKGSLVKWTLQYDKASNKVPEPEAIKEATVKTINRLDAHLLQSN